VEALAGGGGGDDGGEPGGAEGPAAEDVGEPVGAEVDAGKADEQGEDGDGGADADPPDQRRAWRVAR